MCNMKKVIIIAVLLVSIFNLSAENVYNIGIINFSAEGVTDENVKLYLYILSDAFSNYNGFNAYIVSESDLTENNINPEFVSSSRNLNTLKASLSLDAVISGTIVHIDSIYVVSAKLINTENNTIIGSSTLVYSTYDELLMNVNDVADILLKNLDKPYNNSQDVSNPDSNWVHLDDIDSSLPAENTEDEEKEERNRYFGVFLGAPAILGLQLEIGRFYSFISGSFLFPVLFEEPWYVFGAGMGPSFYINKDRTWKCDIFISATLDIYKYGSYDYYYYSDEEEYTDITLCTGLGLGFHYNNPNGFTVAFKAPVFGLSFNMDESEEEEYYDESDEFYYYYMAFVSCIPCVSVGYRF